MTNVHDCATCRRRAHFGIGPVGYPVRDIGREIAKIRWYCGRHLPAAEPALADRTAAEAADAAQRVGAAEGDLRPAHRRRGEPARRDPVRGAER